MGSALLEEPGVAARVPGKYERLCWERHERDLRTAYGDRWDDPTVYGDAALSQHPKGYWFDPPAGDRPVQFIEHYCRHFEGDLAGQLIILEEWQRQIYRVVFGWKRASGARRFRTAYIEIPRKNGKSVKGSGTGLYLTVADGEGGAQVYSAATKKDQAKIVHDGATKMVKMSPELKPYVRTFRNNISVARTGSKFEPLGADSRTLDGLNTHGLVEDETHAHTDRHVHDVIVTSMGARRQPLSWIITTAGVYDPESIGWELHERATQVLDGIIEDDTFFAFIAAADGAGLQSFKLSHAMRQLDILCSCHSVSTTQIVRLFAEACATHAISSGIGPTAASDALTTLTDSSTREASADRATWPGSSKRSQKSASVKVESHPSGQANTEIALTRLVTATAPSLDVAPSWIESDSESMDSPRESTTPGWPSSGAAARSVDSKQRLYAWTTATLQALFAGCSASSAIQHSVYSETLKKLYSEHSPTCDARKGHVSDSGAYSVDLPADDFTDPATWAKANPNLGISVKLEYMAEQCDRAKTTPSYLNTFLRYHLNIWTQQRDRWIPIERWNECTRVVDEAALLGRSCYGGLDLSATTDLTALALCFPQDDGFFDLVFRVWCPKDTIIRRSKEDRVQYDAWERSGWLIPTPGNVVDYAFVVAEIAELADRYQIEELAYDPWNATQTAIELGDRGLLCVEFRQGYQSMSEPSKAFEKLVTSHKIGHATPKGINPLVRWALSNAAIKRDPAENIKPDKSSARGRIDPIVAAIMATGRAIHRINLPVWEVIE